MSNYKKTILLCVFLIGILIGDCLVVTPERAGVIKFNEKFVERAKLYIKRAGRRSKYCINLDGKILKAWGNNVTVDVIFLEYLHNEYRRTFIEIHTKLCDLLSEAYIGGMFVNAGIDKCPVPVGEYLLENMSVPGENFPYIFPMEKGRAEITFTQSETGEFISKAYVEATFKK